MIRTVRRHGVRYYVDEADYSVRRPSVTAILDMLPRPFLAYWQARMVAELAVDSISMLPEMAERDRQGAIDYLKGAARRYTKQRAEVGSTAHDLFERMIRGEQVGYLPVDMRPYERHFAHFLDRVQPELVRAEDVAWSDTHDYAGSFDAILRVRLNDSGLPDPQGDVATVIADWKTSKSIYTSVALQMSAYAHADYIISPDGTREPMPAVDGACVLHITPESWSFAPVRIDRDPIFATFLHLRRVFDWEHHHQQRVLSAPIAEGGSSLVTGTQRRS